MTSLPVWTMDGYTRAVRSVIRMRINIKSEIDGRERMTMSWHYWRRVVDTLFYFDNLTGPC